MFTVKLNNIASKHQYYIKAFLYAIAVAFIFFVPFIILDKGYFLYYGDFNVQQIPFYQMVHNSIRNGEFFWSFNTDLGANLIGSYTFYLLTSPFFWITIPFSSSVLPYLMGPLLILKFGCASLTAYIYLKRYIKIPEVAILCAILYAFSGFSIYNIFFNHFHEAIIIFPLVLWSLDCYMYEKKRGVFALMIFASCFINYYFFVGQVVFLILYWLVKFFMGYYKTNFKEFLLLILEAVIGVLLSCVALIPTIFCVIQNPRVNNFPNGWSALLYSQEQRYIHIIECFLFPPDLPARPNFTPNSDAKWASLGAYLPLFSVSGVIAFFKVKKNHWAKRLLIILSFVAMIPISNSMFQLFNATYYARWFYMITLIMSLVTGFALENARTNWDNAIKWTLFITALIAIPIGFMPKISGLGESKKVQIGLMEYPIRFWIYVAISVFSLFILYFIMVHYKNNKKTFYNTLILCTAMIIFISSVYIISEGKSQSYSPHNYIIPTCFKAKDKFDLPEMENCRVDVYNGMDNQAMFWQMPTIQAFHSIVPGSIMEFYPTIGVKRDVGSRPDTKVYGLRSFASCRWLFDYVKDNKSFEDANKKTLMPGWKYYGEQNDFAIWENRYYVPYGFSYDYYVTREQYDSVSECNRHLLLLKAVVLDDKSIKQNEDILKNIEYLNTIEYTENEYFKDCLNRKKISCYSFERGKSSFKANVDLTNEKNDRIIFFSIPYEKGWSCKVNGQNTTIEKVNIGFMAVRVPGGTVSTIEFKYKTPGLVLGGAITLFGIILFAVYKKIVKKRKTKHYYRPATQEDINLLMENKPQYRG